MNWRQSHTVRAGRIEEIPRGHRPKSSRHTRRICKIFLRAGGRCCTLAGVPDVNLRTRRNGTEEDRKRQQEQSAQAKEDGHSYAPQMQREHRPGILWRKEKQTICLETDLFTPP